jgi:gliding motility-associated-like protein
MGATKILLNLKQFVIAAVIFLLPFTIKAQTVEFTATPTVGCIPMVVSFTDQTTGGGSIVGREWVLGNGTTVTGNNANPSSTYFNAGSYTVRLTVTFANGQTAFREKTNYIVANAKPTVAFTGTPTTGCVPLTVNFTDNSTPGIGSTSITDWLWNFGDGTSSSQQTPPAHVYSAASVYNVTLTVKNSAGCENTLQKPNYINVGANVTAGFTYTPPSGCSVPETVSFQNTSVGTNLTYLWNFGDNTTSTLQNPPPHVYSAAGTYTVTLTVTNQQGCTNTFTHPNPITIGAPIASFTSPASVCEGTVVNFTNTSSPLPSGAQWNFGDGGTSTDINPTHTYTTSGTYTISMTGSFGTCSAVAPPRQITILPKPSVTFTGNPVSSCSAPFTVNFTSNSPTAATYLWDFGDNNTSTLPNPSHTYTTTGNFNVTLTVTNAGGCSNTFSMPNFVQIETPVITFNNLPDSSCAPFTKSFSASVSGSDPVVSYLWNFGDGNTSTSATPSHTFTEGVYNITLTVVTQGGCSITRTLNEAIIASSKPEANFDANPRVQCAYAPISFTSTSTGTITQYLWLFGDGGTSTQQNPVYSYNDTGYFNVTLIIRNRGCTDTMRIDSFIRILPPIAAFSTPVNCVNKYVRVFTDASIGADTYSWNFGDGSPLVTIPNPTHTFPTMGTFTVSLTVTNATTGCSHTDSEEIIIADEPAGFTVASPAICKGLNNTFTANAPNNPAHIATYAWNFGDGNNGSGSPITHSYANIGAYNVGLTVTDINGCQEILTQNAAVNIYGPIANFAPATAGTCLQNVTTFNDLTTTDGIHPITSWKFTYGDGTIQTYSTPPFAHTYANAGVYTVALEVTDSYGCIDDTTKVNLLTISNPTADFSANTPGCPNSPITFANLSTGPNLTYAWNFGDGSNPPYANTATPTHFYQFEGDYTVTLTVTDQYGCSKTETKLNYIAIHSPVAGFTTSATSSTCPPLNVQFQNTSQYATSYVWNFGDNSTTLSNINNPTHPYIFPGVFVATLSVTSAGGCTDQETVNITVGGPTGTISYSPFNGCAPLSVNFVGTSPTPNVEYIWDFTDGVVTPASPSPTATHVYSTPGSYLPRMILKDPAGCTVPILGTDTIKVSGVLAKYKADTLLICGSGIIQFTNQSISNEVVTNYEWDFGDGSPVVSGNFPTTQHNFTSTGIFNVKLTVTTASGCTDDYINDIPVKVARIPIVEVVPPANKCTPANMIVTNNHLNPDTSAMQWQWQITSPSGFVIHTNVGPNSNSTYDTAGVYTATLIATTSSGCKDTASNTFEIYPKPIINATDSILICKGTGQALTVTGGVSGSYVWSPTTGLSCTTCDSPIANPDSLIRYVVQGASPFGCLNTDTVLARVQYPFTMPEGADQTICIGKQVTLTASGAQSYQWSANTANAGLSSTTGSTVQALPRETTIFRVVGFDGKNCFTDTSSFLVKVFPIPTVNAGDDKTINVGSTATIVATVSPDVNQITWTPNTNIVSNNGSTITVNPRTNTTYKIQAQNAGGCKNEDLVNIFVVCNGANVYIPNTFSPNADGMNDVFYPRGTGLFSIKQIKIFNRWGEMVFENFNFKGNDEKAGWNGTHKGQPLMPDAYVYIVDILCDNNTILQLNGNVTLIR